MNIDKIKRIVNSDHLFENEKKSLIINELALDENVLPLMMRILENERRHNSEISSNMNFLLSKAHIALDDKKVNKDGFIQREIVEFYTKYKDYVGHCFKNLFEK